MAGNLLHPERITTGLEESPADFSGAGAILIPVERIGRVGSARTVPPRACERCGCRLSIYRSENDGCCWSCLYRDEPEHVTPSERERRLTLLLAGQRLRVVPAGEFVCPDCGDVKSKSSRRCGRCHYVAPHPKKVSADVLKSGPCPVCGGRKSPKARLCRSCWAIDQRLLFAGNPAVTCPECGGSKVRKAERCRQCRDQAVYGTVYRNGRPVSGICPDCGGPKKLARARRCRACAVRQRSSRTEKLADTQALD